MGGSYENTAAAAVCRHQPGKALRRSVVQPRRRFVQQPERAVRNQEPGDRGAPPLAGRQIAERQMPDAGKPDDLQGLLGGQFRLAAEIAPEAQILRDAECRLHRVLMAEIVAGGGNGRECLAAAFEGDAPACRRQKTRDNAKQRRFSRPIGTDNNKRLPLAQREADIREYGLAAAFAAQIVGDKPHRSPLA
jgi:hypothetical protein